VLSLRFIATSITRIAILMQRSVKFEVLNKYNKPKSENLNNSKSQCFVPRAGCTISFSETLTTSNKY